MKIIVDKEAREVVEGLIDIALKSKGNEVFNKVNLFISKFEEYTEPVVEEYKPKHKAINLQQEEATLILPKKDEE